jgi:outer membrane receptor protein involved in Fe transport
MRKSLLLLSAATMLLAHPALAQTAAPAPADPQETADDNNSGDIIVTATRRAERLADVPLAISAVTSETLANSGANDIRQLNQVAPSLLVSSTGTEANSSARIRGIGTVGDNPGLESSVAVFIDGVYRSRTGSGLNDLGEIDRIEVLRGPQGTLFGRNASAGLIHVITRSPEFTFGANAEATYGNYDNIRLSAGITGPITQQLAFRLDGVFQKRDGFLEATNTDYDVNNRNRYVIRGQLLFEPNSDISVRIIGDYSKKEEDCCGAVYATQAISPFANTLTPTNPVAIALTGITGTTFAQYFPGASDAYSRKIAVTPGRGYYGETEDWGISGQVDWNLGAASLTSITAYRKYTNLQAADADYGIADILNYLPGSGREFKTFSQELRLQGSAFDDKLDWLIGGYYANEDLTSVSRLQVGSQYGRYTACRLVLSGGLAPYYSPGSAGCLAPAAIVGLRAGAFAGAGITAPAGNLLADAFLRQDGLANLGDNNAIYNQTSDNFAIFTHNIVHITDKLDLTLGLRYTKETKHFDADLTNNNTVCGAQRAALAPLLATPLAATAGGIITLACVGNNSSDVNALTLDSERKEDRLTGTAVLSYKPTDSVMLYGSFSRGYKAGGYNLDRSPLQNPSTTAQAPISPLIPANNAFYGASLQFDEETVDAFEVGVKYSSRAFSLNVAAFRQEFTNFQLNTFNGTVYVVQNINGCGKLVAATQTCAAGDVKPGVTSMGVEVEATIVPVRNVRIGLGFTYADTKYADALVGNDSGTARLDPALFRLPGEALSHAPEAVVTSSLAWTPELGGSGLSGLFYVDSRLTSDYNTGSDLAPQKMQDGYVIVNGRVGIRGPNQNWAVEVWAQNLFDQDYVQTTFTTPYQSFSGPTTLFSSYLGEPRTYGVTLRGKF